MTKLQLMRKARDRAARIREANPVRFLSLLTPELPEPHYATDVDLASMLRSNELTAALAAYLAHQSALISGDAPLAASEFEN